MNLDNEIVNCISSLSHRKKREDELIMYMNNSMFTDDTAANKVQCLYRVSTDQQVSYNDKKQADLPMQRKACHKFCERMGWTIVLEDQEEGVSGHKVRAENRAKLQPIKERAKNKQFVILFVLFIILLPVSIPNSTNSRHTSADPFSCWN